MTEQEIVYYLKENKNKGVIFAFMPEDVQIWCWTHKDEPIFNLYLTDGWSNARTGITCCDTNVYCLPEDYKIKQEFQPHWEEFEIDKDGFFRIKKESYTYYCWFNWQKFLEDNFDKYNNFGGWCFINSKDDLIWITYKPLINKWNGFTTTCTNSEHKEMKPIIPIKISFWRIKE